MNERIIPLDLTFEEIMVGSKSLRIETPTAMTRFSVLGGTQGLTMGPTVGGGSVDLKNLRITEDRLEFDPAQEGTNVKFRLGLAVKDGYPLVKMYLTPLGAGKLTLNLGGNHQTSQGGQIIFEITEEAIRSLKELTPS